MIEYDNGIHVKGTELWFDSKKKTGLSFISHANIENFTPSEKILATPETIKLLSKKFSKSVVLTCPYNRPFSLGNIQVELIPSGYMLGAAQIQLEKDGQRIIYTSNLNLKMTETAKAAEARRCNTLILKCTFGSPNFTFPSFEKVLEDLREFIDNTLSAGFIPVILAETFGSAQDIIKSLSERGYKLSLEKSIYQAVKIYEKFGVEFTNYERFKPKSIEGKVLIIPPHKSGTDRFEAIQNKRVAIVIEWSFGEGSTVKSIFRADEAFQLSNQAGHDELIKYVELVRPETVYLIHGQSTEFSKILQKRGFNAIALERPSQLNLF